MINLFLYQCCILNYSLYPVFIKPRLFYHHLFKEDFLLLFCSLTISFNLFSFLSICKFFFFPCVTSFPIIIVWTLLLLAAQPFRLRYVCMYVRGCTLISPINLPFPFLSSYFWWYFAKNRNSARLNPTHTFFLTYHSLPSFCFAPFSLFFFQISVERLDWQKAMPNVVI